MEGAKDKATTPQDLFDGYVDKGYLGSISLDAQAGISTSVGTIFAINLGPAILGIPYALC